MTKEMIDLINQINKKKRNVKAYVEEGKLDEAKVEKAELEELQAKFDILKDIEAEQDVETQAHVVEVAEADPVHALAEAARHGFRNDTPYPNEGTGSQGGYTVPEDIQTKINKFKEDKFSLEKLVKVVNVTTKSGRRVYQTRGQHTGFSSVAEAGKIGQTAAPTFTTISYSVTKYAGYLPVTNELLADSDANIANVIIEWLGEEDIATRNNIILTKLATLDVTDLEDLNGIKKAVNVTLGQKFAGAVSVITNDDGFNYLDTLQTGQGEYALKPSMDPTKPMERRLAIGSTLIPVVVVPNAVLASTTQGSGNNAKTVMPFYIGDLKDAITIFDRKQISIMQSSEASVTGFNAFEQDMTLFRGIERLDCQLIDTDAIVRGTIAV